MKIQFCPYCGTKLDDGARFCKNCGEPIVQAQQPVDGASFHEPPKTETQPSKVEQVKEDPRAKRKTVYDGELHKCPNCGELLKSFTTVCPSCGYELRGVTTNSPVEALAKKVEMASSLDDKIELITNFYIPNTKEDIYDFFILAVSNLEDKWYDTDDAWRAKLEQAYHKARLSFGNTPEFEYLEKLYNRTRKEVFKRERSLASIFRRNKVVFVGSLIAIAGIIMLTIGIIMIINDIDVGNFLLLISMECFLVLFLLGIYCKDEKKKQEKKKQKKGTVSKNSSSIRTIGKDHNEFYHKNYDDMTEYLKARGFRNVITKSVKKGILDTEGAIEGISVSGNTEFDGDDEYDIDSTIIIRYYSRKQ